MNKWILRPGFRIRKIVILKWIVLGNILTLGYKTTLLSSLITINYEDPIDNKYDLDKSGLPLIMSRGGATFEFISQAPGALMARIFKRKILFTYERSLPRWLHQVWPSL